MARTSSSIISIQVYFNLSPPLIHLYLNMRQHTPRERSQPIDIINVKPLQHQFFHPHRLVSLDLLNHHIRRANDLVILRGENINHLFQRLAGVPGIFRAPVQPPASFRQITPEEKPPHQGALNILRFSSGLHEQSIKDLRALAKLLGRQERTVPDIGIAHHQRQGAFNTIAPNQDSRPARSLWARQQSRASQSKEAALVRNSLIALEQARHDLEPLLETCHARRYIAQLKTEEPVFALLPTCPRPQDHPPVAQII